MKLARSKCPCGKVPSRDLAEARELHARIWASRGGSAKVRLYQCENKAWHWTRMLEPIN